MCTIWWWVFLKATHNLEVGGQWKNSVWSGNLIPLDGLPLRVIPNVKSHRLLYPSIGHDTLFTLAHKLMQSPSVSAGLVKMVMVRQLTIKFVVLNEIFTVGHLNSPRQNVCMLTLCINLDQKPGELCLFLQGIYDYDKVLLEILSSLWWILEFFLHIFMFKKLIYFCNQVLN